MTKEDRPRAGDGTRFEARIYAEEKIRRWGFCPRKSTLLALTQFPDGVRAVDTGFDVEQGSAITHTTIR